MVFGKGSLIVADGRLIVLSDRGQAWLLVEAGPEAVRRDQLGAGDERQVLDSSGPFGGAALPPESRNHGQLRSEAVEEMIPMRRFPRFDGRSSLLSQPVTFSTGGGDVSKR